MATTDNLCRQALDLMAANMLSEAAGHAAAALRDSTLRHDRNGQAHACAHLAAVCAAQKNFSEASRQADDCHRLFKQMADQRGAAIAKLLLATIHQMHLDVIDGELIGSLQESHDRSKALLDKALSKGDTAQARDYGEQLVEFGEQMRRTRWAQAIPYALPLVWLPVIDTIPSDPDTRGAEPVGYLEPVLFLLKSKQEAAREASSETDPGQTVDQLYTARPLPPVDGAQPAIWRPPRLKPNARYAAIRVDPDSARLVGLQPEDYLLVRSLSSAERADLLKQAGETFTGFYFRVGSSGRVEVVNAIPPKFVGEEHVRMLVAQVDAVLRRVP